MIIASPRQCYLMQYVAYYRRKSKTRLEYLERKLLKKKYYLLYSKPEIQERYICFDIHDRINIHGKNFMYNAQQSSLMHEYINGILKPRHYLINTQYWN